MPRAEKGAYMLLSAVFPVLISRRLNGVWWWRRRRQHVRRARCSGEPLPDLLVSPYLRSPSRTIGCDTGPGEAFFLSLAERRDFERVSGSGRFSGFPLASMSTFANDLASSTLKRAAAKRELSFDHAEGIDRLRPAESVTPKCSERWAPVIEQVLRPSAEWREQREPLFDAREGLLGTAQGLQNRVTSRMPGG